MGADPLQVELVDEPLHEEIQLLADLIVAATAATGPLDQRAIDAALSLGPVDHREPQAPCSSVA